MGLIILHYKKAHMQIDSYIPVTKAKTMLLGDKEMMEQIRRSRNEVRKNRRLVDLEDFL